MTTAPTVSRRDPNYQTVVADTLVPVFRPTRLGHYEVLFPLAAGGMGTVYVGRLAEERGFRRLLAIKVLSKVGATTADHRAFLAEARLSASLQHTNVVSAFDFGTDSRSAYIVMELIRGVSLAQLLGRARARRQLLTMQAALSIGIQAAHGLAAAHDLRSETGKRLELIHRDIKPQNVLLSYDGHLSITDFGIAKVAVRQTQTSSGVVKGTVAYMSPEQVSGQPIDLRSDLFALGVLLYESLTGIHPFQGSSPAETVMNIVAAAPRSIQSLRPEIEEHVADLVRRCLSKRPEDRPPSATIIADELARSIHGDEATSVGTLVKGWFDDERIEFEDKVASAVKSSRRRRKRQTRLWIAAAVAAAVVLGAVLVSARQRAASQSPAIESEVAPALGLVRDASVSAPETKAALGPELQAVKKRQPHSSSSKRRKPKTPSASTKSKKRSQAKPSSRSAESKPKPGPPLFDSL